jgi:nucleotide-binding universal stress UspA family protein
MTVTTRAPGVVVGVDGSTSSLLAARWAADEARRRGLGLHVIHAFLEPILGDGYVLSEGEDAAIEGAARHVLDDAVRSIAAAYPDLDISSSLERADPRTALLAAAESAVLTVVGGKGRGRFADVIVGSVALAVAAHGRSPVVVIPPGVVLDPTAGAAPILLGVSDSADCRAAVGFAFDEAAVRGAEVLRGSARAGSEQDLKERAVITEQLAGWPAKYPDVTLRTAVLHGRSAAALVEHGQRLSGTGGPSMVVVGSRGRGGLTGMLLGSTGHALIAHSPWPVVIVREGPTG